MTMTQRIGVVLGSLLLAVHCVANAAGKIDDALPRIAYVQFPSFNLDNPAQPLTLTAQLRVPEAPSPGSQAAVVVLHGSAGIDSRGAYYIEALNAAGIASLEVDMWTARGVGGFGERPALPVVTLPDAYAALAYLAGVPGIDPARIGLLGFSWGGVMTLLAANLSYTALLGGGLQFAAHVAHYPVCWAYNIGVPGMEFGTLTGAPVLIQVGALDDYDQGGGPCEALAAGQASTEVVVYPNAYHAWDRLQPALKGMDPFSHLGMGGEVNIVPSPGKAVQSRRRAVQHLVDTLARR